MDLVCNKDSKLMIFILLSIFLLSSAKITNKGYLQAGKEANLSFDNTNPEDCLEYMFMTNYKKVYFSLTTTPSSNAKYHQRIILTDMPYTNGPLRCSEEPNYCTAISNRIYSQTQATFSKGFPTLYVYVVNQPLVAANLLNKDIESINDSDVALVSTLDTDQVDVNMLAEVSEGTPLFDLTPTHLQQGCNIITSIVPQGASLSNPDCVNPHFCTKECSLLTCQSTEGADLFSLCTATTYAPEKLIDICSAHSLASDKYRWNSCNDPLPYNDSLSETMVSIFLVISMMMTLLVFCVCCYNIRLLKSGQAPCDVCSPCPEGLFPREVEDNPLYKANKNDSEENVLF